MTVIRQKIKIRFKIFSTIIFIGLIVLLIISKINPQIFIGSDDLWLWWTSFIIGIWFWRDKKIFYFNNHIIVSLLLSFTYIAVSVIVLQEWNIIAPVPLASMMGRIFVNKKLDKMRKIDLDSEDEFYDRIEESTKGLVYFIVTAVITGAINLLVKIVFSLKK